MGYTARQHILVDGELFCKTHIANVMVTDIYPRGGHSTSHKDQRTSTMT